LEKEYLKKRFRECGIWWRRKNFFK